ncbi:hypothetical protein [Agreia sp.]|uniref:hypothetical protein n=1 Tax=Agreia sp. TaxID=1872416 RepID=UPI0035BC640E
MTDNRARSRPITRPTFHHTTFATVRLDEMVENLDHGMTMSMYYQDPERNGVEIRFDAFGDWSKSKEWMWASQEFGANPIGQFFDPDKIVEARIAGLEWTEIHQRARAGEYIPAEIPDVHLPEPW